MPIILPCMKKKLTESLTEMQQVLRNGTDAQAPSLRNFDLFGLVLGPGIGVFCKLFR